MKLRPTSKAPYNEPGFYSMHRAPRLRGQKFAKIERRRECQPPGSTWYDLQQIAGRVVNAGELPRWAEFSVSVDDLFAKAAEAVGNKIVVDRQVYGGAPCIAGTRIPVYAILELLEAGWSHKKILSKKGFPIAHEQLEAALRFAAIVLER